MSGCPGPPAEQVIGGNADIVRKLDLIVRLQTPSDRIELFDRMPGGVRGRSEGGQPLIRKGEGDVEGRFVAEGDVMLEAVDDEVVTVSPWLASSCA